MATARRRKDNMNFLETRSISYSILLHALLVLFAVVGIPAILPDKPDPQPTVISVEMLPISEVTNVKPSDQPIQKEQKANNPVTKKPVEPTMKEPPKPPTPTPPTPKEKAEPKPKEPEKNFDPTEGEEPKPKPKEQEKPKEEPKKPEPAKAKPDEFADLLNKLKQEAKTEKQKDAKDATNTAENKTKSDAPYDASLPLSLSEKDAIRGQLEACWNKSGFAGAKDPATLIAIIHIVIQQDGTVTSATLDSSQTGRYGSDPYFRAAADAAIRAAQRCSPLKNLPADKYGSWHETQVTFDPRD